MPTRFCSDGAWRARGNSAVFLRSRDHGSEDAVIFSEIGDDGYFDQTSAAMTRFYRLPALLASVVLSAVCGLALVRGQCRVSTSTH